jgi:hypothetical protein
MTSAQIGTAVFAYIEPHLGFEREFNRWYERDHFYAAAMAGPGAFAGARWVATRPCKDVRPPGGTLFGDPERGSYLATYWLLPGAQPEWDAWTVAQVDALKAQDRMFPARDHVHTAVYRYDWEASIDDGPPALVALDRCFDGVVAIAMEREDCIDAWALELVGEGVPVAAAFTQERLIMSVLGDAAVSDPESHALVLAFVDGDVLSAWRDRVEPALRDVRVRFASPFVRTVPGTDRYVDEL